MSWLLSANYQDSYQQPLTYTDQRHRSPRGTDRNVSGAEQTGRSSPTSSAPARWRIRSRPRPISDWLTMSRRWCRRRIRSGVWNNVQTSNPQTYLTSTATGAPTFGGVSGFREQQIHLGSDPSQQRRVAQERYQGRLTISICRPRATIICRTFMFNPFTVTPYRASASRRTARSRATTAPIGRTPTPRASGGRSAIDGPQEISFGIHGDRYRLENPVYCIVDLERHVVDRHRPALFGRRRRNPHRRAVGAGCLEDRSRSEADARRPAGNLAGAGRLQSQYHRQQPAPASDHRRPRPSISPSSTRPISRRRRRCPTIRTRTGISPRISARPIAIRPSPNFTRTSRSAASATFANPNLTPEQDLNGEFEHRAQMERWPGPADAVRGEDQQRDHLANQSGDNP